MRPLLVFVCFLLFDTPAGLEAFLCCPRAVVAGGDLRGLNNSGGGVRLASPVTCDLVFMRVVVAAAVGTFLLPRGRLGLGGASGVGSRGVGSRGVGSRGVGPRAPGLEAPREALEPRDTGPGCAA